MNISHDHPPFFDLVVSLLLSPGQRGERQTYVDGGYNRSVTQDTRLHRYHRNKKIQRRQSHVTLIRYIIKIEKRL